MPESYYSQWQRWARDTIVYNIIRRANGISNIDIITRAEPFMVKMTVVTALQSLRKRGCVFRITDVFNPKFVKYYVYSED